MPTVETNDGWTGRDIPPYLQGLIFTRGFPNAIRILATQLGKLAMEVENRLKDVGPDEVTKALSTHPFYEICLKRLDMGYDLYGDAAFRMDSVRLWDEVREELFDAAIWATFAQWVQGGCELPEGIFEYVDSIDDEDAADEEE